MNHLRKFNEAKSEEDIKKSIDKMAKGLEKMFGLTVSEDGIITTKNMWGKTYM